MRGFRPIVTIVAATLATAPLAWGQSSPTADQIIKGLMPTAKSLSGPTRGIRPVSPGGSTAADSAAAPQPGYTTPAGKPHNRVTASAAPAGAAATRSDAPSVSLTVEFATGSAELTAAAMTTLDELGKALSSDALASYRFRIEGHTDTVGAPDFNKSLSERRADAVAAYIEHKFGISDTRLTPVGLGSTRLAVQTGSQVPEARNRRVQVINLGA